MSCVIEQFVNKVEDFSSQYGCELTYSYVAKNLEGKPHPLVCDLRAFSLKRYGKWWEEKMHFVPSFSPLNTSNEEFVDVSFETPVLPLSVNLYQTCNTGSVVKIWGSLNGLNWIYLWSGKPQLSKDESPMTIFSPEIYKSKNYINFLRIEMDPSLQSYYPAFESILLVGTPRNNLDVKSLLDLPSPKEFYSLYAAGDFYKMMIEGLCYVTSQEFKNLSIKDQTSKRSTMAVILGSSLRCQIRKDGGYFSCLPEEIIILILRKVDLKTLCRLSGSCKLMQRYVADPTLYCNLDLKSCFNIVNDSTLGWLKVRCNGMKALDMSRCGNYDAISPNIFQEFIVACGISLTTLILDNCNFITCDALRAICGSCGQLEVLSMSRAKPLSGTPFTLIGHLRNLSYLNLSWCPIDSIGIQYILQKACNLTHLKLIGCYLLRNMDDIAAVMSVCTLKMEHLEIWKTKGLSSRGLRLLANLEHLQVADLGWTLSGFVTDGLKEFLTGCQNLRILYITAFRTMTDVDVMSIARLGQNLEQIDIMGNRNITPDAVKYLLFSCQRLQLLDVSYCDHIRNNHVAEWREIFPRVAIKNFIEVVE